MTVTDETASATGRAPLRLALYQPDIPQNTGTMIRMAACLGLAADIVEPAAFDISDRHFRRSGMDYLERAAVTRHVSFAAFDRWRRGSGHRLILAETDGPTRHFDFAFSPGDIVMLGRESAGVAREVYAAADAAGVPAVYWLTAEDNYAGRMLYDKVAQRSPFIRYQRRLG